MGMCFALKHQKHCGEKFHPSLVNLKNLKELRLQQEIEDAHDNKEAYDTRPVWDPKNQAASANLIKQHFSQIQGTDGAPCTYLMRKQVIPPPTSGPSNECAKLFDNQMIKKYPISKPLDLLSNIFAPDVEPPLNIFTHKVVEDNAQCFQELKHI